MSTIGIIIVNFGGPRNLKEVYPFLRALLTDKDVIRTSLPSFVQTLLFRYIAKKRTKKATEEYAQIGGKSPIFEDTEWVVKELSQALNIPVLGFHRYIEDTHIEFLKKIHAHEKIEWIVFPLFPQFSYVTTGSIARWFKSRLQQPFLENIRWVRSYAKAPEYIEAFASLIQRYIDEFDLAEATLLFSAHGLPVSYVEEGDPYQQECEDSYAMLCLKFPKHPTQLAYQSQFGKAQWLQPATAKICESPELFLDASRPVLIIPLSFSSDHIETLYEVEGYCDDLKSKGFKAYRCPALGRDSNWLHAIQKMLQKPHLVKNEELIRN